MWWWTLACTDPKPPPSAPSADSAPHSPPDSTACAPELRGVDPALGDPLGGVWVTLVGDCLDGLAEVTIGGEPCADLQAGRCRTPPLTEGRHDVVADGLRVVDGFEAWSPTLIAGARVFDAAVGVELEGPVGPVWRWEQTGAAAPWHPRDGAGLVWLDDQLWMLGGWDGAGVPEWHGQATTNEVWSSPDLGRTWVLELADDLGTTRFGPRHTVGWLTLTVDGTEYAYVVGGDAYHVTADVWRSADGRTWELVTDAAPWGGRVLQMVGVLGSDLYVMGGQTNIYDVSTALRDVWRSSDGGATWEDLGDAPWAARGMVYNPVEHDGRLWLVGGGTYDDDPRTYYNDVWSFDGEQWTEVLPNGVAPWPGREYTNTWVWAGELWISSGYHDPGNRNDAWHSPDGVEWTEVRAPSIRPGHADGVVVTPTGPIHATGNAFDRDAFQLREVDGAWVTAWRERGGSGLDLFAAPTEAPLWRPDGLAGGPALDFDGNAARLMRTTFDPQPDGRTVVWVGATRSNEEPWADFLDPAYTVVGDSNASFRAEAGYSGDGAELVVTDALGSWADGHVRRGEGLDDGEVHLVGFTQAVDGEVVAFVDGEVVGPPFTAAYDAAYMGWDTVGAGYGGLNRARVILGAVVVVPAVVAGEDLARLAAWARRWR